MSRSLYVVFLAAGMAALLLVAGAARTLAAETSIACTAPLDVVCDISDADGIRAVRVTLATGQGPVEVVNEAPECATATQVSWDPIVPDFTIEVDDCTAQGSSAAGFDNLLHQPLGGADLLLGEDRLVIAGLDTSGSMGVQLILNDFADGITGSGASQWDARLLPGKPMADGDFHAAVFGDDLLAPASTIQFSHYVTDVSRLVAAFDDHHYAAMLYKGDDLVYEQGGIPSGDSNIWVPEWFCDAFDEILDCAPRLTFGVDPATGLCFWELSLPQATGVDAGGERVEANRFVFMEEGPGGPPMAFQRVELTGRNLPYLTLFGEDIRPPLPPHSVKLPLVQGGGGEPDPFGLEALTRVLEAPVPPDGPVQVSESISVEVIGAGRLIEEAVVEPESSPDDGSGGTPRPTEPASGIPGDTQLLRMFNTANKMEYQIAIGGELLQAIHRLRSLQGATGANLGGNDSGADGLPGWLPPRTPLAPDGWSNGIDNRTLLTGTTWWPWRTIVHFSNNCSGALVGPRHILTAAHCINQRGTNNWYSFTVTPGRNGNVKPYGDSQMDPNPQPGDPFRWYFTPWQWRSSQYNNANCGTSCWAASEWDWGLIIIPEKLGYQTGWLGYVARPASQLNPQSHFNRGYPWCGTSKGNAPAGCIPASLYGDTNTCALGNYLFPGADNWNRVIRNSCDISGGHSGSPIYHYFYDWQLGKVVPVASMVVIWEHCYQCTATDTYPNSARRLTPSDVGVISFFRQWKP